MVHKQKMEPNHGNGAKFDHEGKFHFEEAIVIPIPEL